jgi:DNA-binding MarR family transcriptional regulator
MNKQAETTYSLMFDFFRLLKSKMRTNIPANCPSLSQLDVLDYVSTAQAPTMRDVAQYLKVKAPSATALVEDLSQAGFLRRVANPKDRRQVQLALTKKGQQILERSKAERKKVLISMLSPLPPKDTEEFNKLLKKIISSA